MANSDDRPIVILGGGINGAAIARELLLHGLSTCLVDASDLASGATASSSRLVHGGLRYLEYGEVSLVRESIRERARLLQLAADYVQPLRLLIPIENRFGGMWTSLARLVGASPSKSKAAPRGLWLVGMGLGLYDVFARDRDFTRRVLHTSDNADMPSVHPRYHWLYSYHDAQMRFPERFVLALLDDARKLALEHDARLDVYTYHKAVLKGDTVKVSPSGSGHDVVAQVKPQAIINATGAWVDDTLQSLNVAERRLMGGTKGSHFITFHHELRQMLGGRGIYVEANDGRPIFVLPWHQGTLVGTTDETFLGRPEDAQATEAEIEYLLQAVTDLFPDVKLTQDDVALHYAGVRPLPFVDSRTPAAITRRHWVERHSNSAVPLFSIIGGKLTTCRSLAEDTVATVFAQLGRTSVSSSRDRVISSHVKVSANSLAERATKEQIEEVMLLCGASCEARLAPLTERNLDVADEWRSVSDTNLPRRFVRNVIQQEWVHCLSDLIERRLMLLYDQRLSVRCLRELAQLLAEEGRLHERDIATEVDTCCQRLARRYGRLVRKI